MPDPLIVQARHQALGDLPRRTANRFPDKVGIVDGDTRLTSAELDALVASGCGVELSRNRSQPGGLRVPPWR